MAVRRGTDTGMSTPFDDGIEGPTKPDESPTPGGGNDPGASASEENQADTPGYSGGGDADPALVDFEVRPIDDDALVDDTDSFEDFDEPTPEESE